MELVTYLFNITIDRDADLQLAELLDQLTVHLGDAVQVVEPPAGGIRLVETRTDEFFTRQTLEEFIAGRADNQKTVKQRTSRLWNIYTRDTPAGEGYIVRCRHEGYVTTSRRCQGPRGPFHDADGVSVQSVLNLHGAMMDPRFRGDPKGQLKQDAAAFVDYLREIGREG